MKAIPLSTSLDLEDAFYPALKNAAVALCACAWERVYQASLERTKSEYKAGCDAGKAFRQAMPSLCGYENICDYIACASYGMLSGAIDKKDGTRFLYAAQVALAAVPHQFKTRPGSRI
jgi:hypothetical protein